MSRCVDGDIHSPVPFWFLNGRVEEWQIVREFEMMREKGIGEVIVHPRYGLEVEYLSDGWFEIFGWCVREAKKRGMGVWIYDEFNWPSGTAGMSLMKMDPDYRGKYLAVEQKPVSEIDPGTFEPGECMIAVSVDGGQVTETRLLGGADEIASLPGDWRVFNCTLKYDEFYIDTLSTAAVDRFKRVAYDEYYRRFGEEFGKTIQAVFTDEPTIYWVSVGYDTQSLPYTQDFFETFEARHGYDPRPLIPYLFLHGRQETTVRSDFWEHAGFLFNERYHRALSTWCREHGVIYTGHNHHEEPLRYQIAFQGDMFEAMRMMDIPGVDHLGRQTLGNYYISIIGHKICSSAAHFSGKARAMSESFAIVDWDATYTHLKRITDWQYALGINLLVPHAIYHTISGMMKRECPPSFFYQSPQWDDFGVFGDYVKRLEEMLVGGRHLCRVAVMYPLSGLMATYQPDRKTSDFEQIDNFLNLLCLELLREQVDFDLIDMKAIEEARVEDGRIRLADEDYEVLLVPATPYMRPAEVARLREVAAAGVKTAFFHRSMEPLPQNLPDGLAGATFVRSEELASFVDNLKKQLDDDIQLAGGGSEDIMAYRREKNGRKITFLVNRADKHRKVMATIKDYPDAAIFDQETGEYTRLVGRKVGSKTQVQLRFQPYQSYFVVSGVPEARAALELGGEPVPIEIRNPRVDMAENVASVYHFDYAGKQVDVRTEPTYMPFNWDPVKPEFDRFAGTYEAGVEVGCDPAGIRLVIDKDFADCEVFVNGTLVELVPCCNEGFLTDFQDVWASVGHLLKRGVNHLRVESPTKLSEPLRLVGRFHVRLRGTSVALVEAGEPDVFRLEKDYPFYSGTVVYRAEFELDREWPSLKLNLHDAWDAASVRVNGVQVGSRLWAPYTFELAETSKVGLNEIEIEVRNNMANLILGNPRALGLRRMPGLAGGSRA